MTKHEQIDILETARDRIIVQRDDYRAEAIAAQQDKDKQLERVNRLKRQCADLHSENSELAGYQRAVRDANTPPDKRKGRPTRRSTGGHDYDYDTMFGTVHHEVSEWWEI